MKKILLIILLLLFSSLANATVWYGCGANDSNINADNFWEDAVGCDGSILTWDNQVAGDTFEANGKTGIVVNVDPKGAGGSAGKVVLNTAAGGGFVHETGNITITADIGVSGNTGTTDVLTISGGTVTVLGNIYGGGTTNADGLVISGSSTAVTIGASGSPVTIGGGAASGCYGVNDIHTASTTTVYANSTGHATYAAGIGYVFSGVTGTVNYTGNCTGAKAEGCRMGGSGSTFNVTGICTGSGIDAAASGFNGSGGGSAVVTGNIINGARATGVSGNITWTPGAANYIQFVGGTDVYASQAPAKNKVLSDTSVVVSTTGAYEAGTATATGGGAYAY
jgi:hypothetical protein